MIAEFGGGTAPDEIGTEQFAAWFAAQRGERAPSTWNVSLDAVRSAAACWAQCGSPWTRRGCSSASRGQVAGEVRARSRGRRAISRRGAEVRAVVNDQNPVRHVANSGG